jgi:hypothetical protein
MFNFDLAFNCVKPVVKILDDETYSVYLFDNCKNLICVFYQGKLKYAFFEDMIQNLVKMTDFQLYLLSGIDNRKYVGLYRKHFQSEYDNLNQIIEGIPVQRF